MNAAMCADNSVQARRLLPLTPDCMRAVHLNAFCCSARLSPFSCAGCRSFRFVEASNQRHAFVRAVLSIDDAFFLRSTTLICYKICGILEKSLVLQGSNL